MLLVADDSPLLSLPSGLDDAERVWLEAVGNSFAAAGLTYERLAEVLLALALQGVSVNPATKTSVLTDAWGFVDVAHRLGILLERQPRPPNDTKRPEALRHARSTYRVEMEGVRDLRNAVQHLDGEQRKLADSGLPVWGAVSWVTVVDAAAGLLRSCTLLGGGGQHFELPLQNPAGQSFHGRVDLVHLTAHGVSVPLSRRYRQMREVARVLEQDLRTRFRGRSSDVSGMVSLDVTVGLQQLAEEASRSEPALATDESADVSDCGEAGSAPSAP